MGIPAVLVVELGALLSTQHRRAYRVFDRTSDGLQAAWPNRVTSPKFWAWRQAFLDRVGL
jgi:hypothetical protein